MTKYLRVSQILFFAPLLVFSLFLMFKTFQVTPEGNLRLGQKVWSDFAATIPLIRSFSLGTNFPPQYPLFAGPPIRYHFAFYLIVGLLEKIGVRLDFALNIPSALSFFLLIVVIYILGSKIFKNMGVGIVSVILFLFNGSLSFLEFIKTHPISLEIVREIIKAESFASFGPYDGKIISAFWSLNIFTNQRHLALSYSVFLLLLFALHHFSEVKKKFSKKAVILLALLIGFFPLFHIAVFGMMIIALGVFFLLYPKSRLQIFLIGVLGAAIALPQILYMGMSQVKVEFLDPGYLVTNLNPISFVNYWVLNLGLTVIMAPIGFILATRSAKKIFFPFLALFVFGNLFRLSPEVAANHKFFNFFLIGANFFTASSLIYLWKKRILGRILAGFSFFFLIFSGIIDLFPIVNDRYIEIPDVGKNRVSQFILANTPKESVFLNSSYLYDPASLAGRKTYLGWPYFSWSAGYDTDKRFRTLKQILSGKDKGSVCKILFQEKIDFIEVQNPTLLEDIIINYSFFEKNFLKIYGDHTARTSIFDVERSCL